MKTQPQMDIGLWEKFTDSLSAISEGFVGFLGQMFGSSNERLIKTLGYIRPKNNSTHAIVPGSLIDQVNSLEETMKGLRDDEFENLTAEFRKRIGVEHKPLPKKGALPENTSDEGPTAAFQSLVALLDERLPAQPDLDDLLPFAFAACREAGLRTKRMRHYDVQILGGIMLHRGMIAEMVTGEGKTLVATLPAYLNALEAKGVHIVTVNDYLARRDCEWMSPIYHQLGISCGFIQSDMDPVDRRNAYECDLTYGTNSEFGFDYLRDNMKPARWADPDYEPHYQQVQKNLNYAIIDEVDNILIDEARTPLIISGPAFGDLKKYAKANEIAVRLTDLERKAQSKLKAMGHGLDIPDHPLMSVEANGEAGHAESANGAVPATAAEANAQPSDASPEQANAQPEKKKKGKEEEDVDVSNIELPEEGKEKRLGYYFEVKEKERTCHLTDEGVRKAEELAGVESFYTAGNMEWPHLIDNALKAHHLYHKDKQYVVMPHPETREMSVIIVDEFTGRLMVGRQWSDGLHQAVEAKHLREGVKIKEETQTLATVTLQNFFKLYNKLAGMTGTAMTEASEFWKIYKLDVVAVPTNKPLSRLNYPDAIYLTEKEKWEAVVTEVELINRWDVIRLKDGTNLIGTIKNETDTSLVLELRDTKERRTLTEDEVSQIQRKGRPILIGTTDVAKSEKLAGMLKRRGIKHELLNAKPEYAAREAEIVAQAGRVGAVSIATNMAGRGTDIILGGNPEYLAWARLKDTYETRLDVPDDVWKKTVEEIKTKEKMDEEGRAVAEMGGVHIIGTERHEARRIDNQLRGRAGRQGDPGSSRFYLSLEDDLMRIFAGDWVKKVLSGLGMEYGQSIESRMVSRRIESAQKKVEEKNFDIRKHLLEYDEVMDHQRKRTYGFRQEILNGGNCKLRILDMIESQVDSALDRYLDDYYGPASFAQLASDRLGLEYEASDFVRASFAEAEQTAKDRAHDMIDTQVQEALDENLSIDLDPKEWNWKAMSDAVNARWSLKTTERQLKQLGRDNLGEYIIEEARKHILQVDLTKGEAYLDPNWGVKSFCSWADSKFEVKLDFNEFIEKPAQVVKSRLMEEVRNLYREKEIEFPVTLGIARFMSDRHAATMHRYDREGLFRWYQTRFKGDTSISEEDFRTQSRARLTDMLVEASRKTFPAIGHADIDDKLLESLEGATYSEEDDARELCEWAKQKLGLEFDVANVTGLSLDETRDLFWNAYDRIYRPEMRRMERSLLLNQLDLAWKNHLYTMDHLRQGIGLVGYAQIDPKTEYKRQGMKEFDSMWDSLQDKITNVVFRMEDDESFQESVWSIGAAIHEEAEGVLASSMRAQQDAAIASSQRGDKKPEPIRNRQQKVGRNDPCPCNSGKKYKNCCMRSMAK